MNLSLLSCSAIAIQREANEKLITEASLNPNYILQLCEWFLPSDPMTSRNGWVLSHLLLWAELCHCSPRSCETPMKLLCTMNPEPTTYVNLGTGPSNPWLDYLSLHSGSLSTCKKTMCKLRHLSCWTPEDSIQRSIYTSINQKAPPDTQQSTLRSGMRRYLYCSESISVLYQ